MIKSYSKINLFLKVLKKKKKGLHNIQSTAMLLDLHDEISIKKTQKKKDEIVFSKLMNIGDEYSYKISDNYTLTAGNAGNIIIFLDSMVIGKAGKAGEVVDSVIINKYFNQ